MTRSSLILVQIFELDESLTLQTVCLDFWDHQSEFILDYTLSRPSDPSSDPSLSEV